MMIHRCGLRPSVLLAAALSAGCSASADTPLVERTDSAGISIVRNLGGDRPLAWTFEPVLRLGGADAGPELFYRLAESLVGTDASGDIFVLDVANHRVVVFDSTGTHLRSFGGEGEGPGEMSIPAALGVAADGTVTIADLRRPSLSQWDSAGNPLSKPLLLRPLAGQAHKPFAVLDSSVAAVVPAPAPEPGDRSIRQQLVTVTATDTVSLATVITPRPAMLNFGCVGIEMSPRFTPELIWDADRRRVAVSAGAAYDIHLFEGAKELRIRRDLSPREVTHTMAVRDADKGLTVGFGGSAPPCKVSAELLLERQGYAPILPAIGAIALSTDGSMWVRRGAVKGEPDIVDIFDPDGAYRGTLPPESPFPVAFMPDGGIVAIEKDELDVDQLVVYRIDR